jgi:hypothetical protein
MLQMVIYMIPNLMVPTPNLLLNLLKELMMMGMLQSHLLQLVPMCVAVQVLHQAIVVSNLINEALAPQHALLTGQCSLLWWMSFHWRIPSL